LILKSDFLKLMEDQSIDFSVFDQAKYVMIAVMGLKCEGTLHEQQLAIKSFLGQKGDKIDIETYIGENIDKENTFYIVDKQFWD